MAYCVHCGVKLGDAEAKCPLCGTPAHDPSAEPVTETPARSYPVRAPEQTLLVNRRYAVSLLSLLLLVPAGLCVLIDWIGGGISWSVYPAGVLILIWIAMAVPLLLRRHRFNSTIVITGASLAGYLFMIEALSETGDWFLPIVLPSLALFILMFCYTVWLIRGKHLRILRLIGVILIEIGILCLLVEILVSLHIQGSVHLSWSPYVLMPCFFIALLLYVISRNGPLSAELKRRFHF